MNFYNGKSEQPFLTHTCCQSHFLGKTLAKEDESERLFSILKGADALLAEKHWSA